MARPNSWKVVFIQPDHKRTSVSMFVVRTLTFGLVLLITPFLPASNLFFRVGFVIAERVLYLSTAGYCLILAYAVAYCCYRWRKPKVGILACDISLFSFLISTLRPYFIVTNVAFSSGSWHHTVLFNVLFFFFMCLSDPSLTPTCRSCCGRPCWSCWVSTWHAAPCAVSSGGLSRASSPVPCLSARSTLR